MSCQRIGFEKVSAGGQGPSQLPPVVAPPVPVTDELVMELAPPEPVVPPTLLVEVVPTPPLLVALEVVETEVP